MRKKKITTIEDLGILIQGEFLNMDGQLKEIRVDIKSLKLEIAELRNDIDDIKLRMGEVAFRFEIGDMEKRLRRLEIKTGIK